MDTTRSNHDNEEAGSLRRAMVNQLKHVGVLHSTQVEQAFLAIPRHLFVPEVDRKTAYLDAPIVTRQEDGRAISSSSAPSVMAIMLEMLDLQPGQRVLEIGAGTGYNAALIAHIVGKQGSVVTIDLDEDIVQDARAHLQVAGIENVEVLCQDGGLGSVEYAPYDCIMLTVAANDIPAAWYEQLRPGGRLVLPLQLLSFRSRLAMQPYLPDQFLLAFAWNGHTFESIDFRPCGFIQLRGDFAAEIHEVSASSGEPGLSAILSEGGVPEHLFQILRGPSRDEATGAHLLFWEILGLRRWLALREPHYCEVYVQDGTDAGAIPAQVRWDTAFSTTPGLYEQETACLLLLQEEKQEQRVSAKHPLRVVIRVFGAADALAERLREQVETWEKAGYPFVWDNEGRMKNLHIRAQRADEAHIPLPYETALVRPFTRFRFIPETTEP